MTSFLTKKLSLYRQHRFKQLNQKYTNATLRLHKWNDVGSDGDTNIGVNGCNHTPNTL